jgi:hypothetical protein
MSAVAPLAPFAMPDEGGRTQVPALCDRFQTVNDGLHILWMKAIKCAALENALDRLGHVQSTAAERCVNGENAVVKTPDEPVGVFVSGQIVHQQQQTQGR